jgi:hypothetical protein
MVFMTIVLLFPVTLETSAQTMNYSVVVVGGVILLSLVYYFTVAHQWFEGPAHTTEGFSEPKSDSESQEGSTEKAMVSDKGLDL